MKGYPMKSLIKRFLLIILAASIGICLTGCVDADPTLLNEKVTTMIALSIEHDTESRYSMLYPGVIDVDTYRSTAKMIDEYFPVTANYTWELQQWNATKGLGNPVEIYDGQYKISFDGKTFYAYVVWRSDSGGDGFTRFQIVSEEDQIAAKGN